MPFAGAAIYRLKRAARFAAHRLVSREISLTDIEDILDELDIRNAGLLVVYSAWEVMHVKAAPNDVVEALLRRLAHDGCLAFPTAPFSGRLKDYLLSKPVFDLKRTPSCRGLLTEIARRRKDALRTPQPGCPFSLLGPAAERYARMQKDLTSPYSEDSFLAECHRQNALVLTLGLDFTMNTTAHYVERRNNDKLGLFSKERLPYTIKDGSRTIESESEYIHECSRDWKHVHEGYVTRASFKEIRRHGVDYSRIRENDCYEVVQNMIDCGWFRRIPGEG